MKQLMVFICLFMLSLAAIAQQSSSTENSNKTDSGDAAIMQGFTDNQDQLSEAVKISDLRKRQVMFALGVPLLLLLMATAALGIAMGVYGKPVFVPHMICAGLSMTLALAHAVVGLVWFYPF